ncbi:MAG TPA: hypothetical protein VGM92_04805, partial [Candidatus Kapabacteria bacterium]
MKKAKGRKPSKKKLVEKSLVLLEAPPLMEPGAQRGPQKNPIERRAHLARVADLYCQGKFQSQIAAELGRTQQAISLDLKILQRMWERF